MYMSLPIKTRETDNLVGIRVRAYKGIHAVVIKILGALGRGPDRIKYSKAFTHSSSFYC